MDYYTKNTNEVLRLLDSSASGLSDIESRERLKEYGPNTISVKNKPLFTMIMQPFMSVFMAVLFLAAVISFWEKAYIDGAVILAVVLLSAVMDYAQQYSTSRILRSLRRKTIQKLIVLRKDKTELIDTVNLVPGDIVFVEEGDKIPTDGRVLTSEHLQVDESQLTGESLPITKQTTALNNQKEVYEQSNMVFQGSFVVGGKGSIIVTSTGNATEFGRMAALSVDGFNKSPVEVKIDKLVTYIIIAVGIMAVCIFGLSLLRGDAPMEALRFTIALAVSAVPEGLPVAISVILAVGMRLLAKQRALVRNGGALESIGVITTIATDKTGTLTKNQLSVQELWGPNKSVAQLQSTIARSVLRDKTKKTRDPLDVALESYAHKKNLYKDAGEPFRLFSFEHTVAISGALYHNGEGYKLYLKGSPETILAHSKLSSVEEERALAALHHMTSLGFRVIAFAQADRKTDLTKLTALTKKDAFQFDGFVAIADTLRREARASIAKAQAAGVSVRMITGDHFETAFHIGKELGLVTNRGQVFDSRHMTRLNDEQLADVIQGTYVFSRVTPERKHRLLTILKQKDITAMTGDGINDVPAITNAHVGIAMGSGSDIAKDAGDIILLDDNFRTIVTAISIGRTIYANVRRMVTYLISTNLGEVFTSFFALLAGMPLPLLPLQILWINLVTDTTTVIPLGLEPEHKNIMKSPPTKPDAPLLSQFVIGQIIVVAISISAVTLTLFNYSLQANDLEYARSVAFWTLAVTQWGIVYSLRATLSPIWEVARTRNFAMYFGLGISVLLQWLAIFGPFAVFLHAVPLKPIDTLTSTVAGIFIPLAILELYKYFGRKRNVKV